MFSKSEAFQTTPRVCQCSSSTQTQALHSLSRVKDVQHPVKLKSRLTRMPKAPAKLNLTPDIGRPKQRIYKLLAMPLKRLFLIPCCDLLWTMTTSSNSSLRRHQIRRICFEFAHPQLRSKHSFQFRKTKMLWEVEVTGQQTAWVQLLAQRQAKASLHNLWPTFSSVVCPSSLSRWNWNKNWTPINIIKSMAQALWSILWQQPTNEPTQNQVLGHLFKVLSKKNWLVQSRLALRFQRTTIVSTLHYTLRIHRERIFPPELEVRTWLTRPQGSWTMH